MPAALAGRRVLVVGGASGIGQACAGQARQAGARVAVVDRASTEAGLRADVRDAAALDAAIDLASARLGGLDGLIYAVGIDLLASLADTSDADWMTVLDVNLAGAMRACRSVLNHLPSGPASIVLVSSGAGLRPLPERSAYCASKAGLNMLAKVLAMELAPRGVRVNAVCPGAVETPLFRSTFDETADIEAARATVRARYALGRIAGPEEIAHAILFLLSEESSYVTGIAMAADGGRTFH